METAQKERIGMCEKLSPVLSACHMVGEHADRVRDLHLETMGAAADLLRIKKVSDEILNGLNRDVEFLGGMLHPALDSLVAVRQFHSLVHETIQAALRAFGSEDSLRKILGD